jgi:hypothetical protein
MPTAGFKHAPVFDPEILIIANNVDATARLDKMQSLFGKVLPILKTRHIITKMKVHTISIMKALAIVTLGAAGNKNKISLVGTATLEVITFGSPC